MNTGKRRQWARFHRQIARWLILTDEEYRNDPFEAEQYIIHGKRNETFAQFITRVVKVAA